MVLAGASSRTVCESLGITASTLSYWRVTHGWPMNGPQPYSADTRAEALRRIDGGSSLAKVRRDLGIARRTLGRWLRLRGKSLLPGDDNVPATWRCDCTPFGVRVTGTVCPACGTAARWAA